MPAKVTVIASLQSVIDDLVDVIRAREPGEDQARMLDRLSEETAEAGAMIRALPARPREMGGHDCQMLAALRTAHAAGEDIGETIARALAWLAAELGGSDQVVRNRPGSREATLISELLWAQRAGMTSACTATGPRDERRRVR